MARIDDGRERDQHPRDEGEDTTPGGEPGEDETEDAGSPGSGIVRGEEPAEPNEPG